MAVVTPTAKTQFLDAAGAPLVGGKLYTYVAGTTTPQATFTDSTGATPNSNPVILDSRGEANVWLGEATYKFTLTDSNDVEIWTVDYISAPTTALSPVLSGNVVVSSDSAGAALAITQLGGGYILRAQSSAGDTSPVVITSTKNVGIGTLSPAEALDIDDNGKIQFSASGASRTIISADATNSTIEVSGDRNFVVRTNSTTILTVNDDSVTSTVPVVLPGNPTTNLQSAPKQYVDTAQTTAAPAGAITAFAGAAAPTGWLACEGQVVSQTTYAALFAAIGTTWNTSGEGAGNFRLPDLRGVFLRGTGTNATGSSSGAVGPAVGTYAADTYLNHNHGVTDPQHQHGLGGTATFGGGSSGAIIGAGTSTFTSVASTGISVNTSTTGGTETKPKNYGILYIIKI